MDKTERSIEGFFPIPIHFAKHNDYEKINETVSKACYAVKKTIPNSLPEGSSNDHYSTLWANFNLLEKEGFEDLKAFVIHEVHQYAQFLRLDIKNYPLKLSESWVNIHGQGHSQEPHVHPNHIISGVYYVAVPESSGHLVLHSPFKYQMLSPPVLEASPHTARTTPIKPKPGLLVIFQSFTEHSVQANMSNSDRISISFNFLM